ncbi:YhdP family protein [Thermomonas sp. HDW16]|uniref:YhdP family protein n=1 Tax=Thermomonas sp. HDW16 TaxID=2714945 RepID=UPI00140C574B|nr:YhdP family protein [Thermomonas sp. HDW16]QIL20249.1 TIGR02099 family protein [Thermomonas sp. HDW16]
MTTPLRRRLRLCRRGAWYALAALLVLLAIGNGIGSQLLPMVERNPDKIADWLSQRAQRKVAFDHLDTEWTRRGPLLRLDNLRIGDAANPLRIGDAEILVAQYAGLLPGRSFTELRVRGLDLTLQRDAAGRWNVRGLPGQQQAVGDPFATLERLGELQVSEARLHVLAPELRIDMTLPRIDLRMRVDGPRIRGGARAWLRKDTTPFEMALDFDRGSGNGRMYAGTRRADLGELVQTVRVAGISPVSGRGRVQAWAGLEANRVVSLHADTALDGVVLRGTALPGDAAAPTLDLGIVNMDARWAGNTRQWQASAGRLRIGNGKHGQVLDGIAVAGGERYGLRVKRIDASPLLALLALSDRVSPQLRHWLHASSAGVVLEDVDVAGARGGRLRVGAGLRGLHFAPVGNSPGLRGVDAQLQGDADGMRLKFDPRATAAFDWPAGFGVVHEVALDGEVALWRDGAGWSVQTPGLSIVGKQLDVQARGGIGFSDDGGRPRLDLAADIGEAPVSLARQFWVHHLMSKTTVDWLNAALQGGRLRDVHAVVAGDLDDWPFRTENGHAGAGKFRVDAKIVDGLLKFQPDWPPMAAVDADVRFEADGFTIAGKGRLAGVPVAMFKAGIPRFGRAELSVDAEAVGNAKDFLAMLRQSPLHKDYGETLDNLQVAGPASADFHMLLPFHHDAGAQMHMHGKVDLAGASMREERWKLAFDNVRGQARYDNGGFSADGLQVQHDGAPGVLSLRAGPHVRDPKQAFEAELQANIGIDALLDKAGNLGWLKPYLGGRSAWTVAVAIPRGAAQTTPPTRLRLRSNLAGTAIDLPEPVRKPAAQAMAATVDVDLPMDRGEVSVELGNLLSLRSRSNGQQTGVRVQLGGDTAAAPPASGLTVGGRVDRLDALDWIGVVSGGHGDTSLPLRRIEVDAKRLRLLGSDFADARLVLAPAARGTAVQVQGAGIAGSLLVPNQDGATVAGRFDRLYWKFPATSPASAQPQVANAGAAAFDPANIPPMLFEVGELRIGDAVLGSARFRSTPIAGGMRMDEFASNGAKQRLNASGTWIGSGNASRTQLRLDVDSDAFGALLSGLGFGGQLAGGKGRLDMDATWRGGPEAFDPVAMEASVVLDARDGRLLEIEPGAGRVLGLLGVAQLPRRLTLDFRDIFDKGFAFDSIKGDVKLAQGVARTDNLAIKGPAADIKVRGSADLRTQRFDQTVDVLPKSGGLLTAVGAIAGGPVGAAVGAVANAVLDKPLQGLGAKTYRVTGPWSSPKVEVTTRNPATRDTPADPPPQG